MTKIIVPSVGESITEVLISAWLKKVGDKVQKDEALVTLETDKVNVDVTAPNAGIITQIHKPEGASALVGDVVAELSTEAGASDAPTPPASPAAPKSDMAAATSPSACVAPAVTEQTASATPTVMPAAQRILTQANLAPNQVQGTGPGGRILKEDAQNALQKQNAGATPTPQSTASHADLTEIVPLSPMRKRIAERLVAVQHTAAILTTFNEVDMSAVMALRARHQDSFVKKYGHKLGFMSFFVKASIEALRLYPELNASIIGQNIEYHHYYDIGVAVGTERGLVVPVLRRAECFGFSEIEQKIIDFGQRAKTGKLGLEDMQGGTFTITNGGVYGSLMSTPIINPPQSGILGMHGIVERPIGVDGKIELRPMMYIALSYDHRLVDGRGAVLFLKHIKNCLEDPSRMLLEI
jgi:2-oxoglutarate dehydrogenase E2 component (dihydrolipoamide succinyltransferase)